MVCRQPDVSKHVSFKLYTHSENICFNLGDSIVKFEDSVKLLVVTIDLISIFQIYVKKKLHAS